MSLVTAPTFTELQVVVALERGALVGDTGQSSAHTGGFVLPAGWRAARPLAVVRVGAKQEDATCSVVMLLSVSKLVNIEVD